MSAENSELTSFGARTVSTAEKPALVKNVFANVSSRYDLMNDLMSLGAHRAWKDAMVDWLAPRDRSCCLDLAGGTGDIAKRIIRRAPAAIVNIVDFTPEMLFAGQEKLTHISCAEHLNWIAGDAMQLPFPDHTFDYCTIGFGIRNFASIDKSLLEIKRVLKLGGRLMILEFSQVANEHLNELYDNYSFKVIPQLGGIVTQDTESYRYLVESIRNFPSQVEFAERIKQAGFEQVKYRNLSLGIVAIHSGWKL